MTNTTPEAQVAELRALVARGEQDRADLAAHHRPVWSEDVSVAPVTYAVLLALLADRTRLQTALAAAEGRARAAEAATDIWRRRHDDTTETLWARAKATEQALAARDVDLAVGVDQNVRFARARADAAEQQAADAIAELDRIRIWKGVVEMEHDHLRVSLKAAEQQAATLREALLQASRDLRTVGDDYPGSSCHLWCHTRADAADSALLGWDAANPTPPAPDGGQA